MACDLARGGDGTIDWTQTWQHDDAEGRVVGSDWFDAARGLETTMTETYDGQGRSVSSTFATSEYGTMTQDRVTTTTYGGACP